MGETKPHRGRPRRSRPPTTSTAVATATLAVAAATAAAAATVLPTPAHAAVAAAATAIAADVAVVGAAVGEEGCCGVVCGKGACCGRASCGAATTAPASSISPNPGEPPVAPNPAPTPTPPCSLTTRHFLDKASLHVPVLVAQLHVWLADLGNQHWCSEQKVSSDPSFFLVPPLGRAPGAPEVRPAGLLPPPFDAATAMW